MSETSINSGEVTQLLNAISGGSSEAFDQLLPVVYESLKQIARSHLRRSGNVKTLCTTDLVHEAYLKMIPSTDGQGFMEWKGRVHFYAVASRAMRQILVDYARRQQAAKRGNPEDRITLTSHHLAYEMKISEILTLNLALDELDKANKRLRKVVEYRFFGGLMEEEISKILGISTRTVERDWVKARLFLHRIVYPVSDE